jgi:hypothetical protein
MCDTPFDILAGSPGRDAKWIESLEGLDLAQARMRQLAAQQPGAYFIFNTWNMCVVSEVNTQAKALLPAYKVKTAGVA